MTWENLMTLLKGDILRKIPFVEYFRVPYFFPYSWNYLTLKIKLCQNQVIKISWINFKQILLESSNGLLSILSIKTTFYCSHSKNLANIGKISSYLSYFLTYRWAKQPGEVKQKSVCKWRTHKFSWLMFNTFIHI
jgi:hypothetical protein